MIRIHTTEGNPTRGIVSLMGITIDLVERPYPQPYRLNLQKQTTCTSRLRFLGKGVSKELRYICAQFFQ